MSDLIKEAEANVIKVAKAWSYALEFCDALASFVNNMCNEYMGKEQFFEGLQIMRGAMYHEYVNAIRNCFLFSAVGGEESKKFSLEMFKEAFRDEPMRYTVMQFLEANGRVPGSYKTDDEKEFRRQAKEAIKKETTNDD
jgi:hypothetical protein